MKLFGSTLTIAPEAFVAWIIEEAAVPFGIALSSLMEKMVKHHTSQGPANTAGGNFDPARKQQPASAGLREKRSGATAK